MDWELAVDEFDEMENRNPEVTEYHRLKSTIFEDAKEEAVRVFRSLPRYKTGPYGRNRVFPRNPRLVLRLRGLD